MTFDLEQDEIVYIINVVGMRPINEAGPLHAKLREQLQVQQRPTVVEPPPDFAVGGSD